MNATAGQFFTNQNLFSSNYLKNHLPETSLWQDHKVEAARAFAAIKAAYKDIQGLKLGPGEEASLEDRFIRPVLKTLGFAYDVQPVTQRGTKKKRPDYALFASEAEFKEARQDKTNLKRFFSHALTIAEAKYWNRPLNDTVNVDKLDSRDATAQLVKYLEDVHYHSEGKILWGILTNGKLWRLFYYRAASRSGSYYEADLEEIIRSENLDAFKRFYLFFARDAFIKDSQTSKTWLDQHWEGSETYAKVIGEKLKEKIFDRVFERLAEGFLEYRRNRLGIKSEDEASLKEVFNGCLTLLYRLLFILYAESRELLPVRETHGYYTKSFQKLKGDIVSDLRRGIILSHHSYDYWSSLETLRRIINESDKDLNVPKYNGGLFQLSVPDEDQSPEARAIRFVRDHKLADLYLAEAIEDLTVDDADPTQPGQVQFIDYSSLGVRRLGDIYEGLLEFHVRVAAVEMAEVREKGRAVWKSLSEVKTPRYRRKHPGEVYIENSRHERRATGSYFTPHYIVEYIVKHAVGPVLEERLTKVRTLLEEYEELQKKAHRQKTPGTAQVVRRELLDKEKEIFDTLFSLKVLDPAMGSGHFLVHTVDFIADRIIAFLAEYPENPVIRRVKEMRTQILEDVTGRQGVEIDKAKLTEVNLIKRMVMKRCIYGVDLNPMAVELAKLSLWLDSFTLGAPLSFLDHHLKCGNSLIGARDVQAHLPPGSVRRNEFLQAMGNLLQVAEITDATASEVEQSRQLYYEAVKWLHPTKERVNVQTAKHFIPIGNEGMAMEWAYRDKRETDDPLAKPSLKNFFAAQAVAAEKRFFHWELEFPEVFFDAYGLKAEENQGFDAVIGNPPYFNVDIFGKGSLEQHWLRTAYAEIWQDKSDILFYFLHGGLWLTRSRLAMIVSNAFIASDKAQRLRRFLAKNTRVHAFVDFRDFPVFEAGIATCIPLLGKGSGSDHAPCLEIVDSTLSMADVAEGLQEFGDGQGTAELTGMAKATVTIPSDGTRWAISNEVNRFLCGKMDITGPKLGDLFTIGEGMQTGCNEAFTLAQQPPQEDVTFWRVRVMGEDIGRYDLGEPRAWLIWAEDLDSLEEGPPWLANQLRHWKTTLRGRAAFQRGDCEWFKFTWPLHKELYGRRKLWCSYRARTNAFAYDNACQCIGLTNTTVIFDTNNEYALLYVLALLNSAALTWRYRFIGKRTGSGMMEFFENQIRNLPIRRINFVTSEKERARLLEKGKALYERCLAKRDQACVLGFVEHALKQTPEQADIVHDLLAFLAEQMIEMNKAKQAEVRGFLGWLEREIGVKIDELKNKTKLKDYHEGTFEGFLEVLRENRKSLTIDPSRREFQERLEKEYASSLAKVGPLKARIEATDRLIDQVVYQLYGLTEEEIKIVESTSS